MGVFSNIKAKGNMNISNVNINNGTGVLDQIEEIINKEIVMHEKEIILEFTIKHALKKLIYSLKIGDKIREEVTYTFVNKEDVLNFLKKDFWKIYENAKQIKWEGR